MPTHTALVLDADRQTRLSIIRQLTADGMHAVACTSSQMLRHEIDKGQADICLIGARLPDGDGMSLIRELRNQSAAGLIVLGETSDEVDTVLALEMGADDYISRPFRLRELGARTRAVMRRTLSIAQNHDALPRPLPETYLRKIGDLEVCGILRSVRRDGQPVELTTLEFDVLMVLCSKVNSVLSRARIIEAVHGRGWSANDRAVDGIISRLRRKLFDAETGIHRIKTIHRRGYMLIDDQTSQA